MPKHRTRKRPPRHSPRSNGAKQHHASRDTEATIRVLVYTRAGGRCEITGAPVGYSTYACHHRRLRSQGGGGGPENRLALHPDAHTDGPSTTAVHKMGTAAYGAGWLVRSWQDPARVPVLLHDGRSVLLTQDGRYEEAGVPAGEGGPPADPPTDD